MALPTNPTHVFEDFTTTANTTVQPYSTNQKCAWFAIMNNSDTEIRVKSTATNDATDSIPIAPSEYKIVGTAGPANGYDLYEYGIYCTASSKSYTIEYKKV
jgi:hypothetical protein